MNSTQSQVITDQRNISRYTGLLYSRLLLMGTLFALLIFLQPVSFYFLVFLLFCPWLLRHFFEKKGGSAKPVLNYCAKKYFYTPARLKAEQIMGNSIVLLLSFWQLLAAPKASSFLSLRLAPGILLLIYLICRISAATIVRQKIHRLYMELTLLD